MRYPTMWSKRCQHRFEHISSPSFHGTAKILVNHRKSQKSHGVVVCKGGSRYVERWEGSISWFLGFLTFWFRSFEVSKFLGFKASWLQSLLVLGSKVSMIPYVQSKMSCFLDDLDPTSKLFKNFQNGSSIFPKRIPYFQDGDS